MPAWKRSEGPSASIGESPGRFPIPADRPVVRGSPGFADEMAINEVRSHRGAQIAAELKNLREDNRAFHA